MKKKVFILVMLFFPFASYASIGINSMFGIAEKGEVKFTISNGAEYRQFITVSLSSIAVKEGELVHTPYTRENIESWSLTPYPARTIINKGASKNFKFIYQENNVNPKHQDNIYQASFIPSPYFPEGRPDQHAVQLALAFSPYIIVPAEEDQPLNYKVSYKNGAVTLENYGGTYINMSLNLCGHTFLNDEEDCVKVLYIVSGRKRTIKLPEVSGDISPIELELSTHNLTYRESVILEKEQTIVNWSE